MDSFFKPHTGSCTTKDYSVFSFWFQALERVNCCRQSEVMSQISFPRRCLPLVVNVYIEETLFNFLYIFNVYPEMVDRWMENLIDTNESQMNTLNATFDPFVGTLTTKNMASGVLLLEGYFYRLQDYVKRGDTTRVWQLTMVLIFPLKLQTLLSHLRSQGVTV